MSRNVVEQFLKRLEHFNFMPVNRRGFLKAQARGVILLAAAASGVDKMLPGIARAASVPDLAVAAGGPAAAARAAVNLLGGIRSFVKPGNRVVIKPNLSFPDTVEAGTNTHPEIIRELVAMCREAGASRIRVLDNPLRPSRTDLCIREAREACRVFGEEMVYALSTEDFFRESVIPRGISFKKTEVMKDVLDADVLIAAPVAKSHGSTGVSLSMKGMMGLIWGRTAMHWRYDLHTAVVDLCTLLRPALVVIDGTRVLSTNGPGGPGVVLKPGTVIASRDMVAADAMAVQMFEWYGRKMEPRQVKHIRLAHERGLGRMDVDSLVTKTIKV